MPPGCVNRRDAFLKIRKPARSWICQIIESPLPYAHSPLFRRSNYGMQSFWHFVGTLLGLEAEPKDLTFFQISLRGVIVLLFTLIVIRLGDKRSLSKKS